MTSFYMFRMIFLTFLGKPRMSPEVDSHVHESPKVMTVPLGLLAVGAVVSGWVGIPHLIGQYLHHLPQYFEQFLSPVLAHPAADGGAHASEGLEWGLMALSVAIALFGLWLARRFYLTHPALPERLMSRFRHVYTTLLNKYWVDELYDLLFVNRTKDLANRLAGFDNRVVDGAVNGSAWLTLADGLGFGLFRLLDCRSGGSAFPTSSTISAFPCGEFRPESSRPMRH